MEAVRKHRISLRLVISLIIILISVVPTVFVSMALVGSAISKDLDSAAIEMQSQVLIMADQLQNDDYINKYSSSEMNAVIDQIADIWDGRVQITNSAGRIIKDTYNVDRGRYNVSEYVILALAGETTSQLDRENKTFAVAMPIYSVTETEIDTSADEIDGSAEPVYRPVLKGAILVTVDMSRRITSLSQLQNQSYLLWLAVFFLAAMVALLVTIYVFKPYRRLVAQLDKAQQGTADRIEENAYSETARISELVNKTLGRAQALDRSRREFVSNVSHELKTPITSIRVLADSLNSMEGAPVEMYQEFMQDISKELERESNIIDDLLSMVRLEEGNIPLNISEVDVNTWLEGMLRRLSPLARAAEVDVAFESVRPVVAAFDEPKMGRVITNLTENAIKYNRQGGHVKVRLDADYHFFYISIEDDGIGIPEDALPHLFERFYRVDKARSREAGGTGLGLAISKQIINMHHGSITVSSVPGEGSVFSLKVPLEYREKPEEFSEEEIEEILEKEDTELEEEVLRIIEEQEAGDEN